MCVRVYVCVCVRVCYLEPLRNSFRGSPPRMDRSDDSETETNARLAWAHAHAGHDPGQALLRALWVSNAEWVDM